MTVILSPSRNSAIPLAFGDLADVEVRMGGIISSLSGTMSMSTYTDRDRGVSKAVLFTWQVRFDPAEYRFCHVNDAVPLEELFNDQHLKIFFGWSRSSDPKEAQISLYGGWGPFGSRIRAFERFEG